MVNLRCKTYLEQTCYRRSQLVHPRPQSADPVLLDQNWYTCQEKRKGRLWIASTDDELIITGTTLGSMDRSDSRKGQKSNLAQLPYNFTFLQL